MTVRARIGGLVRDQVHPERIAAVALTVFVVAVVALWQDWQVGVVVALVAGLTGTVLIGTGMQRQAASLPHDGEIDFDAPGDLAPDVRRMRLRLGDDWVDFARAAAVVTASQWASTAGLQRDLAVPASRARHLLDLLEGEGFVGPARGALPRAVLVPADSGRELSRLLRVERDTPRFLSTR